MKLQVVLEFMMKRTELRDYKGSREFSEAEN